MKPTGLFSAFFCAVVAVSAAPATSPAGGRPILRRADGPFIPGSYIVVLKDKIDAATHVASIFDKIKDEVKDVVDEIKEAINDVVHQYTIFNGYSGIFDQAALDALQNDAAVAFIEPDYVASLSYTVSPILAREAQRRPRPKNQRRDIGNFFCSLLSMCPETSGKDDGTGVDIYGLDTGIFIDHEDFGGRATLGPAFGNYTSSNDGNGHGTHTASTAAGTKYGIAPGASLIGIKVLSDSGTGAYSDIIAGIDWAVKQAKGTGKPSVINCSLGGPTSDALNNAVKSAIDAGVHFVAAAGNSAADASTQSPAAESSIITVGAVDSKNEVAYFSNFGPVVDVFSLGVDVTAAWFTGPQDTRVLSGTSMSSPAVAGMLATELSKYGWAKPEDLQNTLKEKAQHVVTGQPNGTTDALATRW